MAKITIDLEKCIGCGSCAAICPEFFEITEENKAHFKKGGQKTSPAREELETANQPSCLDEAIESCPVAAIKKEQ